MQNRTQRNEEYRSRLTDFILHEYGLATVSITPARRGYYGETWKLDTADGSYFVKIVFAKAQRPVYERSFAVVDHIHNHGIDAISRIVKTADGRLYTTFAGGTVGIFEWIPGENIQDERTKIPEYQILAKVYTVETEGLHIPGEAFTGESAVLFYQQWERLECLPISEATDKLLALFEAYHLCFDRLQSRLCLFSEWCKSDQSHFYITHGDAGGNIIVNGERFYLVDWDDPLLAPPERDAWFCLHWDWAMNGFHKALRDNGVHYALRPERLAYYCYYSFFGYLTKYIETYLEEGDTDGVLIDEVEHYVRNSWIFDNIKYADSISPIPL